MPGEQREAKEGPNGRSGGRGTQPARRLRPFRLRSLRDRVLAGVGIGALVIVALIGLALFRASSVISNLERSQYSQLATDARVRLDRIVSRDRSRLMEAAFSDELYSMVQVGVAPPDSFIRPRFVDRFTTQFGDRLVAIYDLSGRRLLTQADPRNPELEQAVAVNGLFRTLDNREPTVGVIRSGDQLIWVGGAPILPTNYADQGRPIRGYLVVAQPFVATSIAPASDDRMARVDLAPMAPSGQPFRTRVATVGRDSVRVDFAIQDIFAQPNTLASLTTGRAEFRAVDGALRNLFLVSILVIAGLAAAAWYLTTQSLVTPAIRTSAALAPVHQGQVPVLLGSQSTATEWSTLTGAVNRLLANARQTVERFDRLTGVVSDGAWERDLNSGEWIASARFKKLVGYTDTDFPNPLAALRQRAHPEDGGELVAWLGAETPPSRSLSLPVRLRRPSGDEVWIRFDAEVAADLSGAPIRITGRAVDISAERLAAATNADATAIIVARARGQGEFLTGLASLLRSTSDRSTIEQQLTIIGGSIAGTLDLVPAPFAIHTLMQEVTEISGLTVDITIVPGIPARVNGDRHFVRTLLATLVAESDRSAGRISVRAELPNRSTPEWIRLVVEDRRPQMPSGELAAVQAMLATGEGVGTNPRLPWRMVHYLSHALGGRAGIGVDGRATQLWVDLPLEGVAAPVETAATDFGTDSRVTFETSADTDQTFHVEPTASGPAPQSAPRVELVADATVTIRLDDTTPVLSPVSDRVRAALAAGDSTTLRVARIALADTPIRLIELRGAVRAGEARTVANITQALRSIADALEAKPMANRCNDLLDAVESQYLDTAEELVTALDHAWHDIRITVEPFGSAAAQPDVAVTSAIDASTLEQLKATITPDGIGLGNQLISLFLAEAPARLEVADRAAADGDLAALKSAINDLKGMGALVGAGLLADRCAALASESALPTNVLARVTELRDEYRRVHDALEPLLGVRAGA